MALVIGEENTRIVPIDAKQPVNGDKVLMHHFEVEYDIIGRDEWSIMSARWQELGARLVKDPDSMTDDELAEARMPICQAGARYIRNIGPLLDKNKQPVEFTDAVKDSLLATPWLQQPIGDGFMAVQRGVTVAEYRRIREKNS